MTIFAVAPSPSSRSRSRSSNALKLRFVPKKDDTPAPTPAPLVDQRAIQTSGLGTELSADTASADTASADTASGHTASGHTACGHTASGDTSPVLVAGRDPAGRASVVDSLSGIMPKRTLFQEVETFWEVLVRAPATRMVVLSGELDGIPTESLLHMLGHRHPELPVISLDSPALAGI